MRDGKVTGERRGRRVPLEAHAQPADERRDRAQPHGEGFLPIDISQAANARTARGSFTFTDRETKMVVEALQLGVLQAADDWASFTARVKVSPSGEERTAVVIVEGRDPWLPDKAATVAVSVDGQPEIITRLSPGSVKITTALK